MNIHSNQLLLYVDGVIKISKSYLIEMISTYLKKKLFNIIKPILFCKQLQLKLFLFIFIVKSFINYFIFLFKIYLFINSYNIIFDIKLIKNVLIVNDK